MITAQETAQAALDARRALEEDIGPGDITAALAEAQRAVQAQMVAKEEGVLAGSAWAEACFRCLDAEAQLIWHHQDGEHITAGAVLCTVRGQAHAVLAAERSALNFLQTLSATATITARYVAEVRGTRARILDTRKTIPGLRLAQKYAVRCGGGHNHRMGLYDAFLIKENHIGAIGSIAAAVHKARAQRPGTFLEVEVESQSELTEALEADVDRILLDDFSLADIQAAVRVVQGRCPLEVSGNVRLENVREYALTGVDYISIGALTKNVQALDLSLRVQ